MLIFNYKSCLFWALGLWGLEIKVKFVSPHCQEAQSDQNTFTEKTGGCLNRLIGDKKKKPNIQNFKKFSLLMMETTGNSKTHLTIRIKTDNFRNKILDFFSLWTQNIHCWVTESHKYGTSFIFFWLSQFFNPSTVNLISCNGTEKEIKNTIVLGPIIMLPK